MIFRHPLRQETTGLHGTFRSHGVLPNERLSRGHSGFVVSGDHFQTLSSEDMSLENHSTNALEAPYTA